MQAVINTFPVEKAVIMKEQASRSYQLSAYFLSKFLSELPLNLLGPALFGTLLYWIIDFTHSLPGFALFLATLGMTALASVGMGILVSTLAPSITVAASLGYVRKKAPIFIRDTSSINRPISFLPTCCRPLPNIIFLLFSGVLINLDSLPAGGTWG